VTKQAFDKGELQKEITTVKRELGYERKRLVNQRLN
jgi:KaiC/GvpD/RAD55 family RecA-like ATPase|tara:strand:- start:336 stop:443 length:108 start_codon:yes stop_codon:yes gene_type:complete